jgi:hypothetical protein
MGVAAILSRVDRIRPMTFISTLGIITLSGGAPQSTPAAATLALKSPKGADTVGKILKIPKNPTANRNPHIRAHDLQSLPRLGMA